MRVMNRLLALVLGAVLAAAAAAVLVDAVAVLAGRGAIVSGRQSWPAALLRASWSDPALLVIAVGFIVVGALLLAAGLVPQRPLVLPLRRPPHAAASIDRRGLEERLRHTALRDPDIVAATVGVRRAITVSAEVAGGTDRRRCRERLERAITSAVEQMDLADHSRTRVKVVQGRERVR